MQPATRRWRCATRPSWNQQPGRHARCDAQQRLDAGRSRARWLPVVGKVAGFEAQNPDPTDPRLGGGGQDARGTVRRLHALGDPTLASRGGPAASFAAAGLLLESGWVDLGAVSRTDRRAAVASRTIGIEQREVAVLQWLAALVDDQSARAGRNP